MDFIFFIRETAEIDRLHCALLLMAGNDSQANASLLQATLTGPHATLLCILYNKSGICETSVYVCLDMFIVLEERLTS